MHDCWVCASADAHVALAVSVWCTCQYPNYPMVWAVHLYCRQSNSKYNRDAARRRVLKANSDMCCKRNIHPSHASAGRRDSFDPDPHRWTRHSSHSTQRTSRRSRADNKVCPLALYNVDRPAASRTPDTQSGSYARHVLPPRCIHRRGLSASRRNERNGNVK